MTVPFVPERSDDEIDLLFGALHAEPTSAPLSDPLGAYLAEAAMAFAAVQPAAKDSSLETFTKPQPLPRQPIVTGDPDLPGSDQRPARSPRRTSRPKVLVAACLALVVGVIALGALRRSSEPSTVATASVSRAAESGATVSAPFVDSTPPGGRVVFSEQHGFVSVASTGDAPIISVSADGWQWMAKAATGLPSGAIVHAFAAHRDNVVSIIEYTPADGGSAIVGVAHTTDLDTWTLAPSGISTESFAITHLAANDLGVVFVAADSVNLNVVLSGPFGGPLVPSYQVGGIEQLVAADSWFAATGGEPLAIMSMTAIGMPFEPGPASPFDQPPLLFASGATVVAVDRDSPTALVSGDQGKTWVPATRPSGAIDAVAGGPAGLAIATSTVPPDGFASQLFESFVANGTVEPVCQSGWAGPDASLRCTRTVLEAQPYDADPLVRTDVSAAEILTQVLEWESDGYVLQVVLPADGGVGASEIALMPHSLTDPSGRFVHERPNGGGMLAGVVRFGANRFDGGNNNNDDNDDDNDDVALTFFEPGTSDVIVTFDWSEIDAAAAGADAFATITKSGFTLQLTAAEPFPDGVLLDGDGVEVHRYVGDDLLFGTTGMFRQETGESGSQIVIATSPQGVELVRFDLSEEPVVSSGTRALGGLASQDLWFSANGSDWEQLDTSIVGSATQIDALVVGGGSVLADLIYPDGSRGRRGFLTD